MPTLIKVATLGAGIFLMATPALAWTVQPAPSTGSTNTRFSDPDEALESTGSNLRESVVSNSLWAQGGAAFTGGATAAYGYSSQGYGFGPVTATSQSYSGAAAYGADGEGGYSGSSMPFSVARPR